MTSPPVPAPLALTPPPSDLPRPRLRFERFAKPRFKEDVSRQMHPWLGCPDAQVPKDHLARRIVMQLDGFDTSPAEWCYSSLGRRGHHPRRLLALWVYAAATGIQYASVLSRQLKTDAALRLLSGGVDVSDQALKVFRREHKDLIAAAVAWTVREAVSQGLVDPRTVAIDSLRLMADASTKSVRTRERSEKRLAQLKKVDPSMLTAEKAAEVAQKIEKHEIAVERCRREGRASHSVTDTNASLMKLPTGAGAPCHRVTASVTGKTVRFVVNVPIFSRPTDYGHLEESTLAAREALIAAGIPAREGAPAMQVAADAGYLAPADLAFAEKVREKIDLLVPVPPPAVRRNAEGEPLFGRDSFTIHEDGTATCPAGRVMQGPRTRGEHVREWKGKDCDTCALKTQCTSGKQRTLVIDHESERLRGKMKARLDEPGAKQRYNQRLATVEPVFSYLEDVLGFRRACSRKLDTVTAEVLLRVLAHNLERLYRYGKGGAPGGPNGGAPRSEKRGDRTGASADRACPLYSIWVSGVVGPHRERVLTIWTDFGPLAW